MIPPKIAQLPPAPVRADVPVDFSTKADAMIGALQPFANQANDLADFVNDRATVASSSAATVAGVQSAVSADRVLSQQAASSAAANANISSSSAVRAEDAAQYVEGMTDGAAPISNPNFQGLVRVNSVPLGTAAFSDVGSGDEEIRQNSENDERFVAKNQLKNTTGQSTEYPMSQKAVTDALTNTGSLASPSATYEYDAFGRAYKIVTPNGDTVIGYNLDGQVENITYPTGRVETFTYDISGNVVSMTATGG